MQVVPGRPGSAAVPGASPPRPPSGNNNNNNGVVGPGPVSEAQQEDLEFAAMVKEMQVGSLLGDGIRLESPCRHMHNLRSISTAAWLGMA